jgi:hypothetical protein
MTLLSNHPTIVGLLVCLICWLVGYGTAMYRPFQYWRAIGRGCGDDGGCQGTPHEDRGGEHPAAPCCDGGEIMAVKPWGKSWEVMGNHGRLWDVMGFGVKLTNLICIFSISYLNLDG